MLKHLTIRNYALIKHLEMDPSAHMNVITGETGAGKSIMLGAIGLLMGNRADTKVLWDDSEKCVIEGVFDITTYRLKSFFKDNDLDYEAETVIRREINPGGKSRAFVNDTPVTIDALRRLGSRLMDIHSQHETLELGDHSFQLNLIDSFSENLSLRESYVEKYLAFVAARKKFDELTSQASSMREESDFINFQLDELVKADLKDDEQETLESELKVQEHSEEIKTRFQSILQLLKESDYSSSKNLAEARSNLQAVAHLSPSYQKLYERLESVRLELNDIASEIEREESNIEYDPERSEWVNERLSTIYRLQKKHRVVNITDLLALQKSLEEKASITNNLDEVLERTSKELKIAEDEMRKAAAKLSESRKKSFAPLSKQIVKLLRELGIGDANLIIESVQIEPGPSGIDKVEILFSANKGVAARPLAQVASGGEFSRLMFCIKYVMAERTAMPTLVLDEIDNGVSGEVAIKLGMLMNTMASTHQLIAISHLPQIAAKAHTHYFVFKDNSSKRTVSNIKLLTGSERVEEIAKMIGGDKPSRIALENAQELLSSSSS